MSIYKFMAGLVETDQEGKDRAGEFDPHEHRIIPHPTTYLDTMTHLLKGSIGAGILAMPSATKRLGVIYAPIALISVGVLATGCIQLLIYSQYQLCKRHRRGYMAYSKSMHFAIKDGPPCIKWAAKTAYWIVEIAMVVWQLGICCIFLVFVAANIKQVMDYYGRNISLRMILLYLLVPAIILNLVKDLKMLAPMSFISNVVTMAGLMLVAFYLIEDDVVFSADKLKLKNWTEIPNFIGTALFALEAVGVILALEYNMEEPKLFVGVCGLLNIGMTVVVILYLVVGVFGYLRYGDAIQSSITLNLPQHEKKAMAAKLFFVVAIFLSFPLQNFVAYSMLWRRFHKKDDRGNPVTDYALRVTLVILPWALAIAVPELGPFISLFGALCLSLLAMVFPGIMHMCLCYQDPKGYGPAKFKLIIDLCIVIIGLVCLVSGVSASLFEILEATSSH